MPARAQDGSSGTGTGSTAERAPDSFPIYAIDVTGATKLSPAEIERIIYKFTGPQRSAADVAGAVKAIQAAYVEKGYESVFVDSPVQSPENFSAGVITIAVSESPVGKVNIVGSKYHSERVVRSQLSSISPGEPINFKALSAEFANADRFPDRKIKFDPKPGDVPGTVDVDLTIKDKFPLHSNFELTNDNSPSTRPLRLSGSVRYTDLWKVGHTLAANFIIAPQRQSDSSVVAASYTAPLIGTPWTLSLSGYRSNSNVAALGGTNVLGNGYQIGLRAAYRLPSTDSIQSISIGPDFKNFDQDVQFEGASRGKTPIRYVPLSLDYNIIAADSDSKFAKAFGESTFSANIGATLGLPVIKRQVCVDTSNVQIVDRARCTAGSRNFVLDDQFTNSSVFSSENFVHFNFGFDYQLATKSDWKLSSSFAVQVANVHLITNEQFSIGGRSSVRGYYESEELGDEGFVSQFEIAGPSLATMLGKSVDELRAYAFIDSGYVRTLGRLSGARSDTRLLGVGGGARVRLFNRLSGDILVGLPLNSATTTRRHDARTVFVVSGDF